MRLQGKRILPVSISSACSESFAVIRSANTFAPDGFRINKIPARTWAIFKCKGAMPDAIQELWRRIYTEFFPASDYAPINEMDFEAYPDGDMFSPDYESEIWVAVSACVG